MRIALLLIAVPLFAASVYEPVPGTGICQVTAMTGATPVHVTVASAAACGISNDSIVSVWGARGVPLAWSNPEADKHLARTVKNLSGNQFDLYDIDSTPAAVAGGSGTWLDGGIIRRVAAKTLKTGPILDLDGTGGANLAAMTATGATQRKNAANILYTKLQSASAAYEALPLTWGRVQSNSGASLGGGTLNNALAWLVDGDTGARDSALWDLQHPDQLSAGMATNDLADNGGHPATSFRHYGTAIGLWNFARAASIMQSELSAGDKTNLINWYATGESWKVGGIDLDGASFTKPAFKIGFGPTTYNNYDYTKGTISIAAPSGGISTVTGVGTTFLTTLAVGDIMYMPHPFESVEARAYKISAITNNTTLSVENPVGYTLGAGNHYTVQSPWSTGVMGMWSQHCRFNYAYGCGLGSSYPYAVTFGASSTGAAPPYYGYYANPTSNLSMSMMHAHYAISLLGCQWGDRRTCWLAGLVSERFYDDFYKKYLPANAGGDTYTNRGYNPAWVRGAIDEWQYFHTNSFSSPNQYLDDTWIDWSAEVGNKYWIPGTSAGFGRFGSWVEAAAYSGQEIASIPGHGAMMQYLFPARASSQRGRYWIDQRGFTSGVWSFNGPVNIGPAYIMIDPGLTATTPATTTISKTTLRSACVTVFGSSECDTEHGAYSASSRTGWTASDTFMELQAVSPSTEIFDHGTLEMGPLFVYRDRMVWGAGQVVGAGIGSGVGAPYIAVGADVDTGYQQRDTIYYPYWAPGPPGPTTMIGDGSSTYAFARNKLNTWWVASAGVTEAARSAYHFKGGGRNYIFQRDQVYTSGGKAMKDKFVAPVLEGTPTSGSVTLTRSTLSFANQTTNTSEGIATGVMGKFAGLSGQMLMDNEAHSDTNLSYSGSSTAAHFFICNSANGTSCDATNTSLDLAAVVIPTNGAASSIAAFVGTRESTFSVLEYRHASLPAASVEAHAGQCIISASWTAGWTGNAQLIGGAFCEGTYEVAVGGAPVSGCEALVVTATGGAFSCPSVAAGAITIAASGVPVITTSSPLPNGTNGSAYSQALTVVGGTAPYACTLLSGTLPTGLSLTGTGNCTISGTAGAVVVATFTIRATDDLDEVGDKAFSLTIDAAGGALTITTPGTLPDGIVGGVYSQTFLATGGAGLNEWTCPGCTLPPGLSLSIGGDLTGTTTTAGTYGFTIVVTDSADATDDELFSITVAIPGDAVGPRAKGTVRTSGTTGIR